MVRKGPVKVRVAEFNEHMGSDGIGFTTTEPPTVWERLRKTKAQPPIVRIARRDEAGHFLLAGDSGSGKSSVIREMLRQIRERGETAVVYDPEIDFTPSSTIPRGVTSSAIRSMRGCRTGASLTRHASLPKRRHSHILSFQTPWTAHNRSLRLARFSLTCSSTPGHPPKSWPRG